MSDNIFQGTVDQIENNANKVDTIGSSSTSTQYPSALAVYEAINELKNSMYPVGSIYMSTTNANPANLFGGTWEQIKGRFLFGADSTHSAGSTGGEETHTLTSSEMPGHTHTFTGTAASHTHTFKGTAASHNHRTFARNESASDGTYKDMVDQYGTGGAGLGYKPTLTLRSDLNIMLTGSKSLTPAGTNTSTSITPKGTNANTGGGSAHNNMPPYLAVYVWKRTA